MVSPVSRNSCSLHLHLQASAQYAISVRQTLVLPCNSMEFRRHLDHGDTVGACPSGAETERLIRIGSGGSSSSENASPARTDLSVAAKPRYFSIARGAADPPSSFRPSGDSNFNLLIRSQML